jgi:hypothetical protein
MCTHKKVSISPYSPKHYLKTREMIITQKEFKNNHSNLRVCASLHDLQCLARFTQGKCAISPSIPATITNKLRGRMNKKQYLGEKIKMSDFEKIIKGALLNFVKNVKPKS